MQIVLGIYLITLLQSPQAPPAELREAVKEYWEGLAEGDKARALPHVHPQSLNPFLKRNEPALQRWKVEEYRRLEAGRYLVTTRFQKHLPGDVLAAAQVREEWIRTDQGWKVRVPSLEEQRQRVDEAIRRSRPLPPRLQVLPDRLRFYRGSDQPAVIVISNGLPQPVRIVGVEADPRWFEVKLPQQPAVAAGSVSRIALYRSSGQETASPEMPGEGLQVILVLALGEERRRFAIPCEIDAEDPLLDWIRKQKRPPRPPPRSP